MSADLRLGAAFAGVLLRPGATLRALARETSARAGASAVALLGVFWRARAGARVGPPGRRG